MQAHSTARSLLQELSLSFRGIQSLDHLSDVLSRRSAIRPFHQESPLVSRINKGCRNLVVLTFYVDLEFSQGLSREITPPSGLPVLASSDARMLECSQELHVIKF